MSLKQKTCPYVLMSLKQKNMSLCSYVFKTCPYVFKTKNMSSCSYVFKTKNMSSCSYVFKTKKHVLMFLCLQNMSSCPTFGFGHLNCGV